MSENDHSDSCPAISLLPPDGSDGKDPGDASDRDTGAVVEAARQRLADGTVDQDTIGRVLVHVLDHPWANRPLIAQAIRDLAPWSAREAAGLIRDWIDDPARSPESAAGQGRARGPDDMLEDAIALAILDPDARAEASRRYRAVNAHRAFDVHEWYARISPSHRAEAAARLAEEGLARPGGVVVPSMVIARVNALIDLGPDQLPRVRELLDKLFADGSTSGAIRQPLASVGPVYLQEAVIAALRSLTLDPERYLPDRAGSRQFRGTDQLVAELAAMPDYRDQLVTALENIAAHRRAATAVRWRAAAFLADLDAAAYERATARLTDTGVADHEAPVSVNPAAGEVSQAWQRIEDYFAAHDPDRLDELGPPATPEEAARCQRVLGLTDEFTGSLARHRYVFVHNRDLFYDDIPRTLESCRRADGGYDVGDMAELGADDWESTYLSRLTAYANDLEADPEEG